MVKLLPVTSFLYLVLQGKGKRCDIGNSMLLKGEECLMVEGQ